MWSGRDSNPGHTHGRPAFYLHSTWEMLTQMGISVDQYAVLHQHYNSIQTVLSMSLQCELLDNFCSQLDDNVVAALLQCVVTRDGWGGGNKNELVTCEYCY